jgi:hypothetical protein
MILRPDQLRLLRLTGRANPYNFGGDSESDSSTQTTNQTTNNVQNNDKRNVASDSAVALSGDGNVVDRSSSSVTSFIDSSSTTSTSLTSFIDNSNKSTNFSDTSDKSTKFTDNSQKNTTTATSTVFTDSSNRSVTNINTDYGSINGSMTLAGSMTSKAFDVAGGALDGTIGVLKQSSADSLKSIAMAFDAASGASALSKANSAAVLGFANEAMKSTADAMADAKDSGQSKMVMTALMVIGAVGVAFALR